eukprot:scaffold151547_cov31-Tisochrysis_lutea.AAC.1
MRRRHRGPWGIVCVGLRGGRYRVSLPGAWQGNALEGVPGVRFPLAPFALRSSEASSLCCDGVLD